jgi:nucleotide-binding universal stress UspA family protein
MRVVSVKPVVVGVEVSYTVQPLSPADIEVQVRAASQYLAELVENIGDRSVSARYQVIEASDSVAKVILDFAQRERVDTIALGTHGKAGVSRLVLGSVSEEVLEHSPIPVLLVRDQADRQAGLVDATGRARVGHPVGTP